MKAKIANSAPKKLSNIVPKYVGIPNLNRMLIIIINKKSVAPSAGDPFGK
ncbi:MAG: hypothetical protein IPH74_05400 [Bacteroidetes bacterium]|nr:hypothetical protein [Bacteroidota bacterium]MBK7504463.1 hypothetical protein [Bacteroidota bacterium]